MSTASVLQLCSCAMLLPLNRACTQPSRSVRTRGLIRHAGNASLRHMIPHARVCTLHSTSHRHANAAMPAHISCKPHTIAHTQPPPMPLGCQYGRPLADSGTLPRPCYLDLLQNLVPNTMCYYRLLQAVTWNSWTSFVSGTVLSSMCAPAVGRASDVIGRRPFILVGVGLALAPMAVIMAHVWGWCRIEWCVLHGIWVACKLLVVCRHRLPIPIRFDVERAPTWKSHSHHVWVLFALKLPLHVFLLHASHVHPHTHCAQPSSKRQPARLCTTFQDCMAVAS